MPASNAVGLTAVVSTVSSAAGCSARALCWCTEAWQTLQLHMSLHDSACAQEHA